MTTWYVAIERDLDEDGRPTSDEVHTLMEAYADLTRPHTTVDLEDPLVLADIAAYHNESEKRNP